MSTRTAFPTVRIYLRALREARHHWPHLGLLLLLGLLGTPIALLIPVPIMIVVDSVLGTAPLPEALNWAIPSWVNINAEAALAVAVALSVFLALIGAVHTALDRLARNDVGERMEMDFRGKLFLQSLHAPALHHCTEGGHEAAHRISQDASAVQRTILHGIIPTVVSLATLATMLTVTWRLAPTLAVTALGTSLPLLLLSHSSQRRVRGEWRGVREQESAAQSVVQEALGGLRLAALFGQEQRELARFTHTARRGLLLRRRVARMAGGFSLVFGMAAGLGTATILFLGVRGVQAGTLSTGELLLIMGYIAQLYGLLQAIGGRIAGQQRTIASAERAFELLDGNQRPPQRPDALALDRAYGHIRFENVAFAYPRNRGPVLNAVTLEIPAGSRVGIAGRSGAGKSTLVNLIIRLLDPTIGRILLDGVDLRDYRLRDLRNQFSVVCQEVTLFSGSIAGNIAYARPEASREEIEEAARLGGADEFVRRLPAGYDTEVGARGLTLSEGERQCIALARAFLKDAPILVLDEPTGALDRHTERHVRASLRRLMAGRTVFVITRQSGVLQDLDFVLQVGAGRVVREQDAPRLRLLKGVTAS